MQAKSKSVARKPTTSKPGSPKASSAKSTSAKSTSAKSTLAKSTANKSGPGNNVSVQASASKVTAAKSGPFKAAKAATAASEGVAEKSAGLEATKVRVKLVRDSFTMPREDFELIAQLKARALEFKRPAKKSELLRAGLQALAALPDDQLQHALNSLRPLKAGRPKNKR